MTFGFFQVTSSVGKTPVDRPFLLFGAQPFPRRPRRSICGPDSALHTEATHGKPEVLNTCRLRTWVQPETCDLTRRCNLNARVTKSQSLQQNQRKRWAIPEFQGHQKTPNTSCHVTSRGGSGRQTDGGSCKFVRPSTEQKGCFKTTAAAPKFALTRRMTLP